MHRVCLSSLDRLRIEAYLFFQPRLASRQRPKAPPPVLSNRTGEIGMGIAARSSTVFIATAPVVMPNALNDPQVLSRLLSAVVNIR